jgi:hypothetical protein
MSDENKIMDKAALVIRVRVNQLKSTLEFAIRIPAQGEIFHARGERICSVEILVDFETNAHTMPRAWVRIQQCRAVANTNIRKFIRNQRIRIITDKIWRKTAAARLQNAFSNKINQH